MRIAWLGPEPNSRGGGAYLAFQWLVALASAGAEIDAYIASTAPVDVAEALTAVGVRIIEDRSAWAWGRWYSRTPIAALASGASARFYSQRKLAAQLAATHATRPYDVVYQFHQIESPWTRRALRGLPPVVVHPQVHAAGELRWYLRERALARSCEALPHRAAVQAWFATRAAAQWVHASRADAFVCPSRRFAALLEGDYHIPRGQCYVVPNPIDLVRFAPAVRAHREPASRVEIIFVSRMSVRKGVDAIVNLSHRLRDLTGRVRIVLVGGHSLFADYRPLLADLNAEIATYVGPHPGMELLDLYGGADMLVQPSRYEPFGLTVAEALAAGLPVVASDEVGAAEGVDIRACRVYPAGDGERLELEVRRLIDEISAGKRATLGAIARAEAERLFRPETVAREVLGVLRHVASTAA